MASGIRNLVVMVPLLLAAWGCVRVQTEPIRVEPIYIEITINHRVQEELDNLFADIDRASKTMEYEPLDPETDNPSKE